MQHGTRSSSHDRPLDAASLDDVSTTGSTPPVRRAPPSRQRKLHVGHFAFMRSALVHGGMADEAGLRQQRLTPAPPNGGQSWTLRHQACD